MASRIIFAPLNHIMPPYRIAARRIRLIRSSHKFSIPLVNHQVMPSTMSVKARKGSTSFWASQKVRPIKRHANHCQIASHTMLRATK